MQERLKRARIAKGQGAAGTAVGLEAWSDGEPHVFRLRRGPNYPRNGFKATPGPALYHCVGVDVVETPSQLRSAIACVRDSLEASCGPLPQVLVVNFQVPFQAGPVIGHHPTDDHGCSVLAFFHVDPRAEAQAADLETASPGVRLLSEYLQERGHPLREGPSQSKCLKAIGVLMDVEALQLPRVLAPIVHRFNGKPVLVERETRRHGNSLVQNVVELAVDIRGFNPVARTMLWRLREQVRKADLQIGLTVQGVTDDELPEQLIGAFRLRGFDVLGGLHVMPIPGKKDQGVVLTDPKHTCAASCSAKLGCCMRLKGLKAVLAPLVVLVAALSTASMLMSTMGGIVPMPASNNLLPALQDVCQVLALETWCRVPDEGLKRLQTSRTNQQVHRPMHEESDQNK